MRTEKRPRDRSDVLFRADAGDDVGLGHVRRCHALAAQLRSDGVRSAFLLPNEGFGRNWLVARGETPLVLDADGDEVAAVARAAAARSCPVVALDLSGPVGQRYVLELRRAGCGVVLLGNHGAGRLAADLSVSPVAQTEQTWRGALGEHVASPSYAILGETFRPSPKKVSPVPTLLITMGGNDPDGLTLTALAAVDRIENPMRRILVVGPGFSHHGSLGEELGRAAHRYEVHYDVPKMAPLVAAADVAVAAFGISAYELAAAGVPAVLVLRQRSERWHAEHFATVGAGVVVEQRPEAIFDALQPLVVGAGLRRRFSQAAERFVDGRGTERVAELLGRLVRDRRKAARRTRAMPKRGNHTVAGRPRDRARGVGRRRGADS